MEATGTARDGTARRERRRARIRSEAQEIALRLFSERRYETVTMAEVAEALDVSERTLFRYFESKESLLDPAHEELLDRLLAELQARPSGEPGFAAVREALRALGSELDQDRAAFALRMALIDSNPSLQAHFLRRQMEIEEAIAQVARERAGITDPDDLRPQLFAASAVCALRVALQRWVESDGEESLPVWLDRSISLLAEGLTDL